MDNVIRSFTVGSLKFEVHPSGEAAGAAAAAAARVLPRLERQASCCALVQPEDSGSPLGCRAKFTALNTMPKVRLQINGTRRGWSLGAARKAPVVFGGLGVLLLIPTIFTVNLYAITFLFALATFSYASFSTIANVLPSDLFASQSVASVSGLSGMGAGIGTVVAFKLIGIFLTVRT
jgi:hypothetical protein